MIVLLLPLGCLTSSLLLVLLLLLLVHRTLQKTVLGGAINRTVHDEVIGFTLSSWWRFPLLSGKNIGAFSLALFILALPLVLRRLGGLSWISHSCLGISSLCGCFKHLVQLSHCLQVVGGQLLRCSSILATLFEAHNHPIFNHVGIVL